MKRPLQFTFPKPFAFLPTRFWKKDEAFRQTDMRADWLFKFEAPHLKFESLRILNGSLVVLATFNALFGGRMIHIQSPMQDTTFAASKQVFAADSAQYNGCNLQKS